jgi:hypothetical protein
MAATSSDRMYRTSILFAIMPLVLGVCIFVIWYYTRSESLELLGMVDILAGLASVGASFLCLVSSTVMKTKEKVPAKKLFGSTLVVLLIIVPDFLVAGAFVGCAEDLSRQRYTLYIENDSDSPLREITISGGGAERAMERIEPRETAIISLSFKSRGSLAYSIRQDSDPPLKGTIADFVSRRSNGLSSVLRIGANGRVDVIGEVQD